MSKELAPETRQQIEKRATKYLKDNDYLLGYESMLAGFLMSETTKYNNEIQAYDQKIAAMSEYIKVLEEMADEIDYKILMRKKLRELADKAGL